MRLTVPARPGEGDRRAGARLECRGAGGGVRIVGLIEKRDNYGVESAERAVRLEGAAVSSSGRMPWWVIESRP